MDRAITTTRRRNDRVAGQIVFVDTPGVHDARSPLNKFMVDEALGVLGEVDAVLMVVEAEERPASPSDALPSSARRMHPADARLLDQLRDAKLPVILAINKVDKVQRQAARCCRRSKPGARAASSRR